LCGDFRYKTFIFRTLDLFVFHRKTGARGIFILDGIYVLGCGIYENLTLGGDIDVYHEKPGGETDNKNGDIDELE